MIADINTSAVERLLDSLSEDLPGIPKDDVLRSTYIGILSGVETLGLSWYRDKDGRHVITASTLKQ